MPKSTPVAPALWDWLKAQHRSPWPAETGLTWHPSQLEECLAARDALRPPALSQQEISELMAWHTAIGADEASLTAIGRLANARTFVVVTGQQPGLLCGPLLVIYKALAAIELAERLRAGHPDCHFVSVFWVASEDHDFDEVRRAFWPDHVGELEEFLMSHNHWTAGGMIGRIQTEMMVEQMVSRIRDSTHRTEFQATVLDAVREAYGGTADLESGFSRLLLKLLAGSGLVLISPLAEWVRRRAAAILKSELARPGQSTQTILKRGEALDEAGFEPALHRPDGAVNAFWVDSQDRRWALRTEGGRLRRIEPRTGTNAEPEELEISPAELKEMLEDPARLSANVVTRPLVQDSILPTVAQVIGPGEAAYLAQVEGVCREFGVFAPVRWPRPQVTLIEPRVARQLSKRELKIEDVLEMDREELGRMLAERELQQGVLRPIEELRQRHRQEVGALRESIGSASPAVISAFERLEQMIEKGYATLIERMLYEEGQDERHRQGALTILINSLHPEDHPQERRLNPLVPFAVNYGLDWPMRLRRMIDFDRSARGQLAQLAELPRDEG